MTPRRVCRLAGWEYYTINKPPGDASSPKAHQPEQKGAVHEEETDPRTENRARLRRARLLLSPLRREQAQGRQGRMAPLPERIQELRGVLRDVQAFPALTYSNGRKNRKNFFLRFSP